MPDWLSGYEDGYRKTIEIETAPYFTSDHADGVVTVVLDSDLDVGAHCDASGHSVRFTLTDNATLLPYDREANFAISAGEANGVFHVKVPLLLAASNTTIHMYYKAAGSDGADPANVWTDYSGTYHYDENPNGGGTLQDSTSNNRDGTGEGTLTSGDLVAGNWGQAWRIGSDEYINIPGLANLLGGTDDFLITLVVFPTSAPGGQSLIFNNSLALRIYTHSGWRIEGDIRDQGGNHSGFIGSANDAILQNQWQVLTFRAENGDVNAIGGYRNGTGVAGSFSGIDTAFAIDGDDGFEIGYSGGDTMGGDYAELRVILGSSKSEEWVVFEANNLIDNASNLTFGVEESLDGSTTLSSSSEPSGDEGNLLPLYLHAYSQMM
jgi:hypothetical protein